MTAPTFLYCIELVGAPIAKIGTATKPKDRLHGLSRTAPFQMKFRRVFRFDDRGTAALQERHIIASANQYRERGEWVRLDAKLDALLGACLGIDVTEDFGGKGCEGRPRPKPNGRVERQRNLDMQVGAGASSRVGYRGGPQGYDAAVIRARLADGYGVEDIAVMDGIPEEATRAVIVSLEAAGKLCPLLHACRARAAAE